MNPLDATQFPGVDHIVSELKTWDWTFAKTPKFKVQRGFIEFIEGMGFQDIDITIEVNKGCIAEIVFKSKSLIRIGDIEKEFNDRLRGEKYNLECVSERLEDIQSDTDDEQMLLTKSWLKGLLLKHLIGNS